MYSFQHLVKKSGKSDKRPVDNKNMKENTNEKILEYIENNTKKCGSKKIEGRWYKIDWTGIYPYLCFNCIFQIFFLPVFLYGRNFYRKLPPWSGAKTCSGQTLTSNL